MYRGCALILSGVRAALRTAEAQPVTLFDYPIGSGLNQQQARA